LLRIAVLNSPTLVLQYGIICLSCNPPSGSSRECGLATGSCKVMMIPPNSYFRIYSGNTLRLKDAKALSIVEGEQRNGVELMIRLKHLHQIAGVVVATSDGHLLRRGFVQLLYAEDHSVAHRTHINDDGTFRLERCTRWRVSAQGTRRGCSFRCPQEDYSDLPRANHAD